MRLTSRPWAVFGAIVTGVALTGGCAVEESAAENASPSGLISDERCEANTAVGELTHVTSFQYAASAAILNVVAADELGYFDELCLDVSIEPGPANQVQLVSAGTSQIAGVSGPSDALTGIASGGDITAVATYGNTSLMTLMTMADSGIDDLTDFAGRTVGYKGVIPQQLQAMLATEGVETADVNWVSVGFDPTILPDGQVDALVGYLSNEVEVLRGAGHDIDIWNPVDYGVAGSFATQIANTAFAEEHPTAVEDFLRAAFKGYEWIVESDENLDQALEWAAGRSEAGYDLELSRLRWQTEAELVAESQPEGQPLGWQPEEQWQAELSYLEQYDLLTGEVELETAVTNEYVEAIHDGTELIWDD